MNNVTHILIGFGIIYATGAILAVLILKGWIG